MEEVFANDRYLPSLIFETEAVYQEIFLLTQKAKKEKKIPPEKIWLGAYFDKELREGIHPSLEIQWISPSIGHGVFSKERIPGGAFIGEYTGVVKGKTKRLSKDHYYLVRYPVWASQRKAFLIDAEERGNFTRFINHSDTPNLILQSVYSRGLPRMIFTTSVEIREGEQLTFDYGPFFWKNLPSYGYGNLD